MSIGTEGDPDHNSLMFIARMLREEGYGFAIEAIAKRFEFNGQFQAAAILRVRPRSLSRIAELSCHEADGGKLQEGQRVAGPVFKILGKTSAAVQPGKRTLNHPAARENDEPLGGVRAFDDLDLDPREKE